MSLESMLANPLLGDAYEQAQGVVGMRLSREELILQVEQVLRKSIWHDVDINSRQINWCVDSQQHNELKKLFKALSDLDLNIQLRSIDCKNLGKPKDVEPIFILMKFLYLATLAELHDQIEGVNYHKESKQDSDEEDKLFLITMRARILLRNILPQALMSEHSMQLALLFGLPNLVTSTELDAQFERLRKESVPFDHTRMLRVANLQRIEELHRYVDYSKWEAPTTRKS